MLLMTRTLYPVILIFRTTESWTIADAGRVAAAIPAPMLAMPAAAAPDR